MYDVFISYAREDKSFALKLRESLMERGLEVWRDLDNLPISVEFPPETFAAIDASHAFLFVVSPDSFASDWCRRELDRAVGDGKRLMPVVYRDVNEVWPPELASVNADRLREEDGANAFEALVDRLVDAIHTDWDHVKEHTRLLIAFREWEAAERDVAHLLRGERLRKAVAWQDQAAGKEPAAQDEHHAYLDASLEQEARELAAAQAQRQRLRRRGAYLVASLLAASGLGVAAHFYREGEREQARIALARRLASSAEIAAAQEARLLDRALLLAVESIRRAPSLQGDQALRLALGLLPPQGLILKHRDALNTVAFSPDGRYVATGGDDETVWIWEATTGREVARLRHTEPVRSLAFGVEGKILATATSARRGGAGSTWLWAVPEGRPLLRNDHGEGSYDIALAFTADGRYLATAMKPVARILEASGGFGISQARGNPLEVWELPALRRVLRAPYEGRIDSLALASDGQRLYVAGHEGKPPSGDEGDGQYIDLGGGAAEDRLQAWDLSTGRKLSGFGEEHVTALALSPDGSTLAAVGQEQEVAVRATNTGRELARFTAPASLERVAVAAGGATVAAGGPEGAWVWRTGKPAPLHIPHRDLEVLAFSPDGETLATAGRDLTVRLWSVQDGSERARVVHASFVTAIAWSPEGARLATTDLAGIARVWNTQADLAAVTLNPGGVAKASLSPDGGHLAVFEGNTLRVLDLAGKREVGRILLNEQPDTLAVMKGGRLVAAGWAGYRDEVRVWNVAGGRQIVELECGFEPAVLAFDPDGKHLAAAGQRQQELSENDRPRPSTGLARIWRVADSRELTHVEHEGAIEAMTFSSDGRYLATSSVRRGEGAMIGFEVQIDATSDSTARIWEVATGRPVAQLEHTLGAVAVAFDPTGRRLATGNPEGAATVWDIASGKATLRLAHESEVRRVAFSPDGTHLATSSDAGVRIWEIETGREVVRLPSGLSTEVEFSTDGSVLTLGPNGAVRRWLWRPSDLIREACSRASRNLTESEWRLYLPGEPYPKTCPGLPVHPSFTARGQELVEKGDRAGAMEIFRRWAELEPRLGINPDSHLREVTAAARVREALTRLDTGQYGKALAAANEAERLHPESVDPKIWNGICWLGGHHGRSREILAACDRAVERQPDNVNFLDSRGIVRALTGDLAGAAKDLQRAAALDGGTSAQSRRRTDWIRALEVGKNPLGGSLPTLMRRPRWLDSTFARDVDPLTKEDMGRADRFLITDPLIHYVLAVGPGVGRHTVEIQVYTPTGERVASGPANVGDTKDDILLDWRHSFSLPLATHPASLGRWQLAVFLDGELLRIETFEVRAPSQVVGRMPPAPPFDSAREPDPNAPLGSAANPVRTSGLEGQQEYLGRLFCPNGNKPSIRRRGSTQSPYGMLMDAYRVTCPASGLSETLYLDLYHRGYLEIDPIAGFRPLSR